MCAFNFADETKTAVPDVSWIDRYGIPIAFLALIVWTLAKLGALLIPWLKQQFEKGFDRHMAFLDRTNASQDRTVDLLEKLVVSIDRQSDLMEQQTRSNEKLTVLYEQQGKMLDAIHSFAQGLAMGDQRAHWDSQFERTIREIKESREQK